MTWVCQGPCYGRCVNHNRKNKKRQNEKTTAMLSLPEYCDGFQGKDYTVGRPRYPCGWEAGTGVYEYLRDDAREGICSRVGVLYAGYPLRLPPADSGADCAADDACERRRRR